MPFIGKKLQFVSLIGQCGFYPWDYYLKLLFLTVFLSDGRKATIHNITKIQNRMAYPVLDGFVGFLHLFLRAPGKRVPLYLLFCGGAVADHHACDIHPDLLRHTPVSYHQKVFRFFLKGSFSRSLFRLVRNPGYFPYAVFFHVWRRTTDGCLYY